MALPGPMVASGVTAVRGWGAVDPQPSAHRRGTFGRDRLALA